MNSYNKNDLSQLATQTLFLRDNLEKVLRLTDVLRFIADNPKLKDCLVLKGGTAINSLLSVIKRNCYLMMRISLIIFATIRWHIGK